MDESHGPAPVAVIDGLLSGFHGPARPLSQAIEIAGAVTFVQRFGGSMNLNPHLHVRVLDGVFVCPETGESPRFEATRAPDREDLRPVLERVHQRLRVGPQRRARRGAELPAGDAMDALARVPCATGRSRGCARNTKAAAGTDAGERLARSSRIDWATLLRRVFLEDVLDCPRCHGRMRILAAITDARTAKRILDAMGLPSERVGLAARIRDGRDLAA